MEIRFSRVSLGIIIGFVATRRLNFVMIDFLFKEATVRARVNVEPLS